MNKFKKMTVGLVAAAMMLSSVSTAFAATSPVYPPYYPSDNSGVTVTTPTTPGTSDTTKPGTDDTTKPGTDDTTKPGTDDTTKPNANATVANTKADGTATITQIPETTKKTVTVKSTLVVDGVSYKVTRVSRGTFANCPNVTTISLPSSITAIGAQAFTGVSSTLKTIKINSTQKVTVVKSAFKGVDTSKMTITVTKKMSTKNYNALKKALTAAGYKGKIKRA